MFHAKRYLGITGHCLNRRNRWKRPVVIHVVKTETGPSITVVVYRCALLSVQFRSSRAFCGVCGLSCSMAGPWVLGCLCLGIDRIFRRMTWNIGSERLQRVRGIQLFGH